MLTGVHTPYILPALSPRWSEFPPDTILDMGKISAEIRNKTELPRLMTRTDVAEYLGVEEKSLANWASEWRGPAGIKFGMRGTR